MYQHIRRMSEHGASLLLLVLLSSDVAFNALHIIQHTFIPNSSLSYTRFGDYLNIYHLIKLFWIIVLFAYLLKLTKFWGYLSWILMFTFFLVDDAFELHQYIGDQITIIFEMSFFLNLNLQPRLLELIVLAMAGLCLLAIVALVYFRSPYTFKKVSNDLLLFILALVFFGIIVDLGSALTSQPAFILGLIIIEDGGEMVTLSLIVWYVFLLAIHYGKPDLYLLDFLSKSKK
jgi:hypothetical protein